METFSLFGLFTLSTNLQRIMNLQLVTLVKSNFDFRYEEVDLKEKSKFQYHDGPTIKEH